MADTFERDGVRFTYPPDWQLEVEFEEGGGWTSSLQGPSTAFVVVSYCPGVDDPTEVVDAAVEGLRDEYPGLDVDETMETIAGQPAIGADINFTHLDLTNTCWIRAVNAAEGAVLFMAQCTDLELEQNEGVLKEILNSLTVDE
jgi:hypothetical protein